MCQSATMLAKLRSTLDARSRRYTLASDRRAGSWARAKARRAQYEFVRRHWLTLAAMGLTTFAVLVVSVQFISSDFARGLVVGGGLVGVASATWLWVVQVTGTAPR